MVQIDFKFCHRTPLKSVKELLCLQISLCLALFLNLSEATINHSLFQERNYLYVVTKVSHVIFNIKRNNTNYELKLKPLFFIIKFQAFCNLFICKKNNISKFVRHAQSFRLAIAVLGKVRQNICPDYEASLKCTQV